MKRNNSQILIRRPKPFQEVGASFFISGTIPEDWITSDPRTSVNFLGLELIDINGKIFTGTSIQVCTKRNFLHKFRHVYPFYARYELHPISRHNLVASEGRLTLRITADRSKTRSVFVPIVVSEFAPDYDTDEAVSKHFSVSEKITRYEEDLREYDKRWSNEVKFFSGFDSRKFDEFKMSTNMLDEPILTDMLEMFNETREDIQEYLNYARAARNEILLNREYADALSWRGPLAKGLVGRLNGFEFRVYSDDHGEHFHVIHSGKGIDARFSFPNIELENYASRGHKLASKEIKRIQDYFKKPENMEKLKKEFEKRNINTLPAHCVAIGGYVVTLVPKPNEEMSFRDIKRNKLHPEEKDGKEL